MSACPHILESLQPTINGKPNLGFHLSLITFSGPPCVCSFMQRPPTTAIFGIIAVVSTLSLAFAVGDKQKVKPLPYAAVAPIIKNCTGCHMGAHPKHGLDLTTYANLMKGDKEGKVVIAGKPASSRLSLAIHHSKGASAMPPGKTLPAADVARIDAWIKSGAKP